VGSRRRGCRRKPLHKCSVRVKARHVLLRRRKHRRQKAKLRSAKPPSLVGWWFRALDTTDVVGKALAYAAARRADTEVALEAYESSAALVGTEQAWRKQAVGRGVHACMTRMHGRHEWHV